MDLRSYVRLLLRRWPVFLMTAVLVGGTIGGASFLITPVYTATAEVNFTPQLDSDAEIEQRRSAASYVQERMATYAQVVTTDVVLEPIIQERDLDMSVEQLVDELSVNIPNETSVMQITANGSTGAEAASIANLIAEALPEAVAELEGLPTVAASPVTVETVQPAVAPDDPSSPNIRLNLVVAAVVAVFVAVLVAVLVDSFDTRVRRGKDVTVLGIPYLGGLETARGPEAAHPLAFSEQSPDRQAAWRRLAVDITLLVAELPAHIVFTAAQPGAGKTTVAANVAAALAEAGNRVVYIDADVRGGRLAAQLRLPQTRGLMDAFAGRIDLDEALFHWGGGDFTVIPAGISMAGIPDVLADERLDGVLAFLDAQFDVVIIDAPPVSNTSEASRVLRHVAHSVLVADATETHRAPLMRAATSLRQSGGELLGVILTRISRSERSAVAVADAPDAPAE